MQAAITRNATVQIGHRIELITPELQSRFDALAAHWQNDTRPLSAPTEMERHPAYREIITMGSDVVPLLLRELQREPDFWFSVFY